MIVVEHVAELRALLDEHRRDGRRIGLVPTMGFFHAGHRSLMRAARSDNDVVVVSIFVNPLQFGPQEDFAAYPRDLAGDRAVAEAEQVDVVFAPSTQGIYPTPSKTTVHVSGLTEVLCGAARPGHFDGVTTVVAKLLSIMGPCRAYFGKKDAQQLAVIRQMAEDLNLPTEIVACPLVRESDGLALSSRNSYLSAAQREEATVIHRALRSGADAVVEGERDPWVIRRIMADAFVASSTFEIEYAEAVRAVDLRTPEHLEGDVLLALAARAGSARLIDNITITINGSLVDVDAGIVIEHDTET